MEKEKNTLSIKEGKIIVATSKAEVSPMITGLNELLANYQIFYQNLRSLHWNIKGPLFFELHTIYGDLYDEIGDRVDNVAERVRALDAFPLDTFSEYIKVSDIKEVSKISCSKKGLKIVIENFKALLKKEKVLCALAKEKYDVGSAVGLEKSICNIEKHLWMFNSYTKHN